jgi:hypothetical protein
MYIYIERERERERSYGDLFDLLEIFHAHEVPAEARDQQK